MENGSRSMSMEIKYPLGNIQNLVTISRQFLIFGGARLLEGGGQH